MRKWFQFKIYHHINLHYFSAIFFLIAVPFIFFLFFSRFAQISLSRLFIDFSFSFYRIVIAYFIALTIGWLLAVLFYQGKWANLGLSLFDVLQSFPTFAALPLAVFFWGPSNFTVIFFLVLTIIWPIFFSIISALKLIRGDWRETVEIFGLSGPAYLKYFLLPVSMPGIITGSIIGLGEGWEALVATEIIVNIPVGLGGFFQSFSHSPTITFFGILGFLLIIFSINKIVWLSLLKRSNRKMEE